MRYSLSIRIFIRSLDDSNVRLRLTVTVLENFKKVNILGTYVVFIGSVEFPN